MYLEREEEPLLRRLLGYKEALVLIGPRRAGKTTLGMRLLEQWQKNGAPAAYFDLESLNAPRTATALHQEIEKTPSRSLILLDEIQSLDGWVKVVRQHIEYGKRHLVLTGSSASLLSKEIASSLGGRAIPETILPISYRDALHWGLSSLDEYMHVGGYPECVLRPNDASRLHKLYLDLTVLRDVAARRGIREVKPLSDLAVLLLSETGKTISAKKTSQMLGISQPTFRSFVSAFNDAFLLLSVPPYLRSPREKLVADARHYAYDLGMQKSVSISTEDDFGRRLENVVAVELVRQGYSLSYLPSKTAECDFIAQKSGTSPLAIQIWSGTGEVPVREWAGLREGMRAVRARGLLLTHQPIDEKPRHDMSIRTIEQWLREPVPKSS